MSIEIASFFAPKQRITRPYKISLVEHGPGKCSVHRVYTDQHGGMDAGAYDLTHARAWEVFKARVQEAMEYGVATWEMAGDIV